MKDPPAPNKFQFVNLMKPWEVGNSQIGVTGSDIWQMLALSSDYFINSYYHISSVSLPVEKLKEPEPRMLENLFLKPWRIFIWCPFRAFGNLKPVCVRPQAKSIETSNRGLGVDFSQSSLTRNKSWLMVLVASCNVKMRPSNYRWMELTSEMPAMNKLWKPYGRQAIL